jgi:hypothetical protein
MILIKPSDSQERKELFGAPFRVRAPLPPDLRKEMRTQQVRATSQEVGKALPSRGGFGEKPA